MLKLIFLFMIDLIILTDTASISESDSTLTNDLNLIANNLSKIPTSKLDIQLALNIDPCESVRLEWNNKFKNIFGFQIVLNEYLQFNKNRSSLLQPIRLVSQNDTIRTYSSNYIDYKVNRFKFSYTNAKHDFEPTYRVCLIIYIDVNDNIHFEKHCINDFIITKCTKEVYEANQILTTNAPSKTNESICDQCKHYSNLLIAFVASLVLLTINIIMFTIIIIQNTLKINILKIKLSTYKQILSLKTNALNRSNNKLDYSDFECTSKLFKDVLKESCFDVFKLLNLDSSNKQNNAEKKTSKKSLENTTTYTITRPNSGLQQQQILTSTQISHLDSPSETKSTIAKYYLNGRKNVNTFHAKPYFGFKTEMQPTNTQSISTFNILDSRYNIDDIFSNTNNENRSP